VPIGTTPFMTFAGFEQLPDAPRNTPGYIKRKLAIYLSHGAGEVCVVDSKRKIMSVYRGTLDQVVRVVIDSTYRCDLLGSPSSCPKPSSKPSTPKSNPHYTIGQQPRCL
jgi:hypothetical protein